MTLSDTHMQLLTQGSAIAPEVIQERGYRTCTGASELRSLGITARKAEASGLLLPLWSVDGTPATHLLPTEQRMVPYVVFRPDQPRVDATGRTHKYLLPTGAGVRLDCPPRCRQWLPDPSVPLWI